MNPRNASGNAAVAAEWCSRKAVTTSGRGESRLRQAFGNAFKYQVTFSRIMPGTSHDSRA